MVNIYLDIETIPCQIPGVLGEYRAQVCAPAQYKKPESIAEWLKENGEAEAEKQWLATALDGGLGQIAVIGFAINDGEAQSFEISNLSATDEKHVLQTFFDAMVGADSRYRYIGHNLVNFDLRFIWHRAMVLGVRPEFSLPRDPKPWDSTVFDTMVAWAGVRDKVSLERLCRYFGIPGKGDMDGSKVWPKVKEGRIAEVAAYCRGDVDRVRLVHKRMTFA